MDSALRNAQAKLDALNQRAQVIDAEIQRLTVERESVVSTLDSVEQFIRAWHEFNDIDLANLSDTASLVMPSHQQGVRHTTTRLRNPRKEDVAKEACTILLAHGRPMHGEELLEALKANGIELRGQKPLRVLTTMMWRMKGEVIRFPGLGYWPANCAYEPAGYNPGDDSNGAGQENENELELH